MMKTLMMLALIALAPYEGSVDYKFTSDSVYKKDNILTVEVQKESDGYETLLLKQNYVLGYEIYDNPETPYIDGLKVDDNFVTDWKIEHFTVNLDHTITIKTVYSNGVDGMLTAARDGDLSKVFSNPLVLILIGCSLMVSGSIIVGSLILSKSKKTKIKE